MSLPEFQHFILQGGLTSERADTFFLQYYDGDGAAEFLRLKTRLISSPQLAFWKPLVEQSILAFQRDDYAICVPALLLIIEGVFAMPWSVNFPNQKDRRRFFDSKIAATNSSIRQYTWKSVASFVEIIFESGVTNRKHHPVPKRNLILHGKSKPATWNRADCLRLFQALSTILWLGRELAVENTGD
jgi:hypothetical protein